MDAFADLILLEPFLADLLVDGSVPVEMPLSLLKVSEVPESVASDATSQIQVLLHHGDTAGVDRTQVSILEKPSQVRLASLLQRSHSISLEARRRVDLKSHIAHVSLERCTSYEVLCLSLVPFDLPQSNSTRTRLALQDEFLHRLRHRGHC